jgi:hypothetical protein
MRGKIRQKNSARGKFKRALPQFSSKRLGIAIAGSYFNADAVFDTKAACRITPASSYVNPLWQIFV